MKENKLETIVGLFDGSEIRSIWDGEKEITIFQLLMLLGY